MLWFMLWLAATMEIVGIEEKICFLFKNITLEVPFPFPHSPHRNDLLEFSS